MTLYIGVDPGQASDPTAISVLRRTEIDAEERRVVRDRSGAHPVEQKRPLSRLEVIHCERLPLHTTYPDVVQRVHDVHEHASKLDPEIDVLLDLTGVGRPVRDMMAPRFRRLRAVTITAGQSATFDKQHGEWHVPKRVLVSCVAIGLQNRTLKIAKAIPQSSDLIHELENFKAKISKAGNDTYEAWREGDHDDLVLSMALCVWWSSLTPAKWTETDVGTEQAVKRNVIKANERRVAAHRARRSFRGGGMFSR